jgi:lysophospholipase L1-like esterase
MSMNRTLSIQKKILFTAFVLALFCLAAELALSLVPRLLGVRQEGQYDGILGGGTVLYCLGDSVTFGSGVEKHESWPAQLGQQLAERGARIQVVNQGVSGMDTKVILQRERHNVEEAAAKGTRPVALMMAGHNDLIGLGWREWKAPDGEYAPPTTVQPPRLVRVLRWMAMLLRRQDKTVEIDEKALRSLRRNVKGIRDMLDAAGGRLYLLTYLLPGDPEGILRGNDAAAVKQGRLYQGRANEALRRISGDLEIRLIDIERQTEAPDQWDGAWFMDHIHPRSIGHSRIADTVRRHLSVYGELPMDYAD